MNILPNRTVLLGDSVQCDGFATNRKIAVITHAHGDACWGVTDLLGYCKSILMSPPTKDLILAQLGGSYLIRANLISIDYDTPQVIEGTKITLRRARHILGASQVEVEDVGGTSMAYTGDFLSPDPATEIVKTETLAISSAYGDPSQVRSFSRPEVEGRFVELVRSAVQRGPVEVIAHKGKLQEAMALLNLNGINLPFVCTPETMKWVDVYRKYGEKVGDCISSADDEGKKLIGTKSTSIFFRDLNTPQHSLPENRVRIKLSGYDSAQPFYRVEDDYYWVTISDSADFKGTLDYVERSKPKVLITDNSRGGNAELLASEVTQRFGIPAYPSPM